MKENQVYGGSFGSKDERNLFWFGVPRGSVLASAAGYQGHKAVNVKTGRFGLAVAKHMT